MSLLHGLMDQSDQFGRYRKAREALTEVDGTGFSGKSRHDGEDGGSGLGKFASDVHGGGVCSQK